MSGTYWTTFCFEGVEPRVLHCTHKYLGALDDKAFGVMFDTIEDFFAKTITRKFDSVFDIEDQFTGDTPDETVTVFKTRETLIQLKFAILRYRLDAFRDDDFTPYQPHVTNSEATAAIIDRYALCRDDEVLYEWKFI